MVRVSGMRGLSFDFCAQLNALAPGDELVFRSDEDRGPCTIQPLAFGPTQRNIVRNSAATAIYFGCHDGVDVAKPLLLAVRSPARKDVHWNWRNGNGEC
jgi:hypothetical protein